MRWPKKVYAIQHNATKKIYIGISYNPGARYMTHISYLRHGKHGVEDMQADFDKYGEDFSLFILEEAVYFHNRNAEYEWMKKYRSNVRGIGYNYKEKAVRQLHGNRTIPYKEGLPVAPDIDAESE